MCMIITGKSQKKGMVTDSVLDDAIDKKWDLEMRSWKAQMQKIQYTYDDAVCNYSPHKEKQNPDQ